MYQLSCDVTYPLIDRLRPSALHLQQMSKKRSGLYNISIFKQVIEWQGPVPQLCVASLFEWTRLCKCAAPGYMSGYNSDHVNPVYFITFSNLYYSNVHTYVQQKNSIFNYLYYKETQLPQIIYSNKFNLLIIKKIFYM